MNNIFLKQSIKDNLLRYIIVFISTVILTITIIVLAPFLVKNIIDNQITSTTSNSWYETSAQCSDSVKFNNTYYVREQDKANCNTTTEYQLVDLEKETYLLNKSTNTKINIDSDQFNLFFKPAFNKSMFLMALFLIAFIITSILSYVADLNLRIIARRTILKLRKKCVEILFKVDLTYFDQTSDSEIITHIVNDTDTFYRLLINVGTVLLNGIIVYLSVVVSITFIDIKLTIAALLFIPIVYIWLKVYRRKVVTYFDNERNSLSKMNSLTNEQIRGIDLIKTYQYEIEAANEFNKYVDIYYKNTKKSLTAEAIFGGPFVMVIQRLFIILIILYFGLSYLNNPLIIVSAGFIFLLVQFVNSITYPLFDLMHIMNIYSEVSVSLKRLEEFYDTEYYIEEDNVIQIENGDIEFKDVSFSYGQEPILKNINLSFKSSTKNAIVGQTGSGKSTIISLLMRFYDLKEGSILVDNQDINKYSKKSLREHIGIVLQDTYLFDGTIYDNITMDLDVSYDRIMELCSDINASFITNHPDGLNQRIDETASNFSSGQKQIIAFLRAIIRRPKILIFDEASSNLDMESEQAINKLIDLHLNETTMIIIAHRLATISNCDYIYVLDNGEVVEEGIHEELMKLEKIYYNYNRTME